MEIRLKTNQAKEVIDLTELIKEKVPATSRAVIVYVAHTTCAITTADLDPGTDEDLLDAVWNMLPKQHYRHPHNPAHAPAHLASSIIGPSVCVPVNNGELVLGSWQKIILVELDGPKDRKIVVTIL